MVGFEGAPLKPTMILTAGAPNPLGRAGTGFSRDRQDAIGLFEASAFPCQRGRREQA